MLLQVSCVNQPDKIKTFEFCLPYTCCDPEVDPILSERENAHTNKI